MNVNTSAVRYLPGMVKESDTENPGARAKRRRTRAERDRLHAATVSSEKPKESKRKVTETNAKSKQTALSMRDTATEQVCSERTALERALKKRSYVPQTKQYDVASSAITSNRLTVRLGIFNKGKASTKIQREPMEPLVVPGRIKQKADNDIQRVLDISESSLSNKTNLGDTMAFQGGGDGLLNRSQSDINFFSLAKSPVEDVPGETFPHARPKIVLKKLQKSLPRSPELQQIAKKLISIIKPCNMFPQRKYFDEMRDDLSKLLKRNAVTSQSQINDLSLRLSATPGRRSSNHSSDVSPTLSRLPDAEEDCQLQQPGTTASAAKSHDPSPSQGDAAPEEMDTQRTLPEQAQEQYERQEQRHPDPSPRAHSAEMLADNLVAGLPMDAKDMLECNEKAMELLQQQQQQQKKLSKDDDGGFDCMDLETTRSSEAAMLDVDTLSWPQPMGNYSASSSAATKKALYDKHSDHHRVGSCVTTRAKEHAQGIRNAYSALANSQSRTSWDGYSESVTHDHAYLPISDLEPRVSRYARSSNDAAVVTEYNYNSMDVSPQLSHHLAYQHPHTLHQETMALDLLDILDDNPGRALSQHDLREPMFDLSQPHSAGAVLGQRRGQHVGLRLDAQDSDESPCWVPRPPDDALNSPPRLYPQRMY